MDQNRRKVLKKKEDRSSKEYVKVVAQKYNDVNVVQDSTAVDTDVDGVQPSPRLLNDNTDGKKLSKFKFLSSKNGLMQIVHQQHPYDVRHLWNQ